MWKWKGWKWNGKWFMYRMYCVLISHLAIDRCSLTYECVRDVNFVSHFVLKSIWKRKRILFLEMKRKIKWKMSAMKCAKQKENHIFPLEIRCSQNHKWKHRIMRMDRWHDARCPRNKNWAKEWENWWTSDMKMKPTKTINKMLNSSIKCNRFIVFKVKINKNVFLPKYWCATALLSFISIAPPHPRLHNK